MPRTSNQFLASLPQADYELIRPHLRPFVMANEMVLAEAGQPISRAYFPHRGVITLVQRLSGGEGIEVAMVGNESVFGGSAAINGDISLSDALVQQAGPASTIDIGLLRRAAQESAAIRTELFRHEQLLFLQAQQSAACNAAHTVDARLSRWLLRMSDLADTPNLVITQEFLAQMIGARRNSVSLVANTLQNAGVIRYNRGRIEITDVEGLKNRACECYATVKTHYDRMLRKTPGD